MGSEQIENQNKEIAVTNSQLDQEMSPTIGKLAAALAKAQGQMSAASKSAANPFFKSKYADLSAVWDVIRDPLSKNGLAVIQTTNGIGKTVELTTRLVHDSGEWIKSVLTMTPIKTDPQGIGSTITYARRYSLAAICGVVQDDDDGNAGSDRAPIPAKGTQPTRPVANNRAAENIEYYPSIDFDKNFAAWRKLILTGKKTSEEIVNMIESKGKLTESQKLKIEKVADDSMAATEGGVQ